MKTWGWGAHSWSKVCACVCVCGGLQGNALDGEGHISPIRDRSNRSHKAPFRLLSFQ